MDERYVGNFLCMEGSDSRREENTLGFLVQMDSIVPLEALVTVRIWIFTTKSEWG